MSKFISEHGLGLLGSIYSITPIAAAPHQGNFAECYIKAPA